MADNALKNLSDTRLPKLTETRPAVVEAIDHISIARQPIVDAGKNILAYELFNRVPAGQHTVASDVSLVLNAIANSGSPFSIARSELFVHATHDGLRGSHWDFLDPKKVVACVSPVDNHDPERIEAVAIALAGLRERGFRLSFNHVVVAPLYKSWQPLADYVKLDLSSLPLEKIGPLVAAVRARTPATPIAMKVESSEQFTLLESFGVKLFQGYWFSAPEVVQPRVLAPGQLGAVQLFNLLTRSAPIDDVEIALKKDASLGVNLLRIINSAGVGLRQPVTSLRQAVMLTGYDKLSKWAALVLATSSPHSSKLVNSAAIVRGRMMELLALEDGQHFDPGTGFLVGLLSHIDSMLGCTLQAALAQLSLSQEIVDALLNGTGPYADMLALAKACETEDDSDFTSAFGRLRFTLRQINMAQMEALAWADSTMA